MIAFEKLLIYMADLYINYRPTALLLISILGASAVALVIGAILEARTARRCGLMNSSDTLDSQRTQAIICDEELEE